MVNDLTHFMAHASKRGICGKGNILHIEISTQSFTNLVVKSLGNFKFSYKTFQEIS
jgi:hypothetical protein